MVYMAAEILPTYEISTDHKNVVIHASKSIIATTTDRVALPKPMWRVNPMPISACGKEPVRMSLALGAKQLDSRYNQHALLSETTKSPELAKASYVNHKGLSTRYLRYPA